MDYFSAVILGVVEGLTEFLPVSSTGHMILASNAMGIGEDEFVKTFEVAIQSGAILAIVFLYARRFVLKLEIYKKLIVAFIPTAIIGFLAYKTIKAYLFSPIVVSVALFIGGIILILVDKRTNESSSKYAELEDISYKNAAFIGLIQCFSMIPGVSRAAATIIGGTLNGLDKKQATEFSFLLAVPTMMAATGYDLLKTSIDFTFGELQLLGLGAIIAFICAWIAVKIFLKLVENYGFRYFAYYRIALGIVFLWLIV